MPRFVRFAVLLLVAAVAACSDGETDLVEVGSQGGSGVAEPSCDDVEHFADVLVDTGITYDYDASESPAALAASTDVVFGGRATGSVSFHEARVAEDPVRWSFVGSEIEVSRVVSGPTALVEGNRVDVFVEYSATQHRNADYYREAVAPGATVAVFAHDHEEIGALVASIEGFATACPGGPILGWVGHQGAWATVGTVDEVLDAADTTARPSGDPTGVTETTAAVVPLPPDEPPGPEGGVEGPVMYGARPDSDDAEAALIEGALQRDGDCLYVVFEDPAQPRYPVLWPYDTAWQEEPAGVVLPDGAFVDVGASFSAGGGYYEALRLEAVGLTESVVERAADCAEGEYREVAVVQTNVDVQ